MDENQAYEYLTHKYNLLEKVANLSFNNTTQITDYLNQNKDFNYPEVLQVVAELKPKLPATGDLVWKCEQLEGFKGLYQQFVEGDYSRIVNQVIETAYKNEQTNPTDAALFAQGAVELCQAALSVLPDNSTAQELLQEAEQLAQKLGSAYAQKVFTSPLHKELVGKIVLSKRRIQPTTARKEDFSTSFSIQDPIYALVYLARGVKGLDSGAVRIGVGIDGNPPEEFVDVVLEPSLWEQDPSTVTLEIKPTLADSRSNEGKEFIRILGALSPRKHTLQLQLLDYSKVVASGEFALDCSHADAAELAALIRGIEQHASQGVRMREPWLQDSMLQAEMDALLRKEYGDNYLRATLQSPAWEIRYHELSGQPLSRRIDVEVAVVEGGITWLRDGYIFQPYHSNQFNETQWGGFYLGGREIAQENVGV